MQGFIALSSWNKKSQEKISDDYNGYLNTAFLIYSVSGRCSPNLILSFCLFFLKYLISINSHEPYWLKFEYQLRANSRPSKCRITLNLTTIVPARPQFFYGTPLQKSIERKSGFDTLIVLNLHNYHK